MFSRLDAHLGAIALVFLVAAIGCRGGDRPPPPSATAPAAPSVADATYVGRQQCARCHQAEETAWRGSHHDLAMQEATAETVLGNFANATFTYAGTTSRFSTRAGKYIVRTDGPDGEVRDFEVAYVFGVYPLQQYLVAFPGGRYQALSIAWDARPRAQGGQRWYHLYAGDTVTHADVLHWTKFGQNWNAQCATCHSTNLRKGYDRATNTYSTTWSEIDVSCESCHGPASAHVAWAGSRAGGGAAPAASLTPTAMGLTVPLRERRDVRWTMQAATGIASRSRAPGARRAEIEICAPCHSRRGEAFDAHVPGQPFLMSYRPALLSAGLYRADGQMQDEVYTYGSFLQSRMHTAGVTCSDCHDPHSLQLKADRNGVCAQCHEPARFDVTAHHGHTPGTSGASCVACHMPSETYMGVDVRHDHSFRVPRPDLSERLGVPNACTQCHTGKAPGWAAAALDRLRTPAWRQRPHFAEAFSETSQGRTDAVMAVVSDPRQPGLVRASAVEALQAVGSGQLETVLNTGAADADPLVRLAAAQALSSLDPAARARVGGRLLDDPMRTIRAGAAAALAGEPASWLSAGQRQALERGLVDAAASETFNADRPESYVNRALLEERRGNVAAAIAEYEAATTYAPWFVPAYVNLAELQRQSGSEVAAEQTLRRALATAPRDANVLYALALSVYRQQRPAEAVDLLASAAQLAPDVPRFAFAYALALESQGKLAQALSVIDTARRRHPADRDLLDAGLGVAQKAGDMGRTREYLGRLLQLSPGDPALVQLASRLGMR